MTAQGYILDTPLPISQNFQALKDRALAYIQSHSDYHWTNFNPSDPGVTILDQLCYALTELGYCNDFSIQDILTNRNGRLNLDNQFYLPGEILTTSPITPPDYKKYIIDGVANVINVVFQPNPLQPKFASVYDTYLLINPDVSEQSPVQTGTDPLKYTCYSAFTYLNKARNICELFNLPVPLKTKKYGLSGSIEIENTDQLATLLQSINTAISNYIFAPIIPKSYNQPAINSQQTDTIFEGPQLKNGWIATDMLGKKKNTLTIYEIIQLIEGVKGICSVTELHFTDILTDKIQCDPDQLFLIDPTVSFTSHQLHFICNNVQVDPDTYSADTSTQSDHSFESNILFGTSIDIRTDIPKSEFKDINSYYSIQNTFPEIYAVGQESIVAGASEFQIAQSRQLKGYLTLFDQLLANQFSQLANTERLFSFRNSMVPAPSDARWYYDAQDKLGKHTSAYPAPFQRFSPTYYYQSLYHIPDIKPLLKDNETFNFSLQSESIKNAEKRDWTQYRLDPYNPYLHGLMGMMEDEHESLQRRSDMLDHLLARHGESSIMINAYIEGSYYIKEQLADSVVFKSLYLQNLGLLSYYRYKAYDYLQADKFIKTLKKPETHEDDSVKQLIRVYEERILGPLTVAELTILQQSIKSFDTLHQRELLRWILDGNTLDSVFDSDVVNNLEKLSERDFRNYSGIELKLNLLFGIKVLYRELLITDPLNSKENYPAPVKLQSLILLLERNGFIMVEIALLQQCLLFDLILIDDHNISHRISAPLNLMEAVNISNFLKYLEDKKQLPNRLSPHLQLGDKLYNLIPSSTSPSTDSNLESVGTTGFRYSLSVCNSSISLAQVQDISTGPFFIFPDYVPMFITYPFYSRVDFFLTNELPISTVHTIQYASVDLLWNLITAFYNWHDSLIPETLDSYSLTNSSSEAASLLSFLTQTKAFQNPAT
jgi:hypothetical protein